MNTWFNDHKSTLDNAIEACQKRHHWAAYPEVPSEKIYGEGSKQAGEDAFNALQNKPFALSVPMSEAAFVAADAKSPYGIELGITYPQLPVDKLLEGAEAAQKQWRRLDTDTRAGVCLEMLDRLAKQSFLMAHAVMHTTGQPFVMSFQAGGPHALDRGLEAVAYAYQAQTANETSAEWAKVVGKNRDGEKIVATLDKHYKTRGKGIGVVIGCATFPTWNSYPGMFADLATGNAVISKPAEGATLPLAIAIDIMRQVLADAGLNPDLVQLANTGGERAYTQALVKDARVKMIDYTGGPGFGTWLQNNCPDTQLYLEQAGINNIFIESTDNVKGMANNIGFSLSLYSGQMCTAPQNIYVPKDGIDTPDGKLSFDEVAAAIAKSVEKLLGDDNRAFAILGAMTSDAVKARVGEANAFGEQAGKVVLASCESDYAAFPNASTAKPILISLDSPDHDFAQAEQFGPVAFVIACEDRDDALTAVCDSIEKHGAMTTSLYCTDADFKQTAIEEIADAGSPLSINLTGGIYVNQSAAFTDFHGSALNPAANTSLTDLGFVAQRFGWVTVREERH
ncbi:MAG: phenylacetic acid degradation protein PaaN [Gammaproteobacteria bacterium]|nr:MAG: phenylacetic acid degradation protein PaaN [Gammaproteobacteria bacterium]